MTRALILLILALCLTWIGLWYAERFIDNASPPEAQTPIEIHVAKNAHGLALVVGRNIILPKPLVGLIPAATVERVWRDEAHCEDIPAGLRPEEAEVYEYRAEVTLHTLFGLPVRTLEATCGGNMM